MNKRAKIGLIAVFIVLNLVLLPYAGLSYGKLDWMRITLNYGCPDSYEPNDSSPQAFTINSGSPIYSYICTSTDIDYFRFYISNNNTDIELTLQNLPGDYDLYLLNSSQNQLAASTNGSNSNESIDYNATTNGYYYIKIIGYAGAHSTTQAYRLMVTLTEQQELPNLVPFTPSGWDYPIIPASVPNTHRVDTLYSEQTTYIDAAVLNDGPGDVTANFRTDIYLDDTLLTHVDFYEGLPASWYLWLQDWTFTISEGYHILRLVADTTNQIAETNESDNTWEREFYWHPPVSCQDGYENDDEYYLAATITTDGAAQAHNFHMPSDLDWAQFTADTTTQYDIATSNLGDNTDTVLEVYDRNNVSVISNDDCPGGGLASCIRAWTPGSNGTYYIRARQYGNSSGGCDGYEYNLSVTATGVANQPDINIVPESLSFVEIQAGLNMRYYPTGKQATKNKQEISLSATRNNIDTSPRVDTQLQAKRGTGLILEPHDKNIKKIFPLANVPAYKLLEQVDHSAGLPPVGNQGSAGSCTGWATAYYYKSYQEGQEHSWDMNAPEHQFSPNYVWNQIQVGGTAECKGASVSRALELIQEQGVSPLSIFPYTTNCHIQPTEEQRVIATNYKARSYGAIFRYGDQVTDAHIRQMKQWLMNGDTFVVALDVTPEFDNPAGANCIVDLPTQGDSRGGHAIQVVGYDDSIGGFKIVNSWGTNYGCNGFAYLTYDWVKEHVWYAYWMIDEIQATEGFDILNEGTADLQVTDIVKQNGAAWLTVTPPSPYPFTVAVGQQQFVSIAIDATGLSSGEYTEQLLIYSNDPDENPYPTGVHIQLTVQDPDAGITKPSPSDLSATALSATSIQLTWQDNNNDEDSFRIERSPDGASSWEEIGYAAANVTTYTDSTPDCGTTYYYRVRSHSSTSGYSGYSNITDATTDPCTTCQDAFEPDNDYTKASTITAGASVQTHNFGITADVDWLQLDLDTSAPYTIRTLNLGERNDTVLEIYAGDGVSLVTSNDDCPNAVDEWASCIVDWLPAVRGTYFIKVYEYGNNNGGCEGYEYDIELTLNTAPTPTTSPIPKTNTPLPTATSLVSATATPTPTATDDAAPTETVSPTTTDVMPATATPTPTATDDAIPTDTVTPTATATEEIANEEQIFLPVILKNFTL